MDTDVVVVGGGPGGTATAIVCAEAGLDVVVLDRRAFPREHPGETLHPGVEAPLRALGVFERVCEAGFLRHAGVWVDWEQTPAFAPYGRDERGPWRGYQAWRADFDRLLLDRAREVGVRVIEACRAGRPLVAGGRVTGVETTRGPIAAHYVVDAAGDRHWLAHHLGLALNRRSPHLTARFGYVAGACPERDEQPAIVADGGGWTWTARIRPGIYQWTRLALDGPTPASAAVPSELAGLSVHRTARTADVTWRAMTEPAGPGYVAVGDAAVVLDPASSHGVLRALMTGMHAAGLITAVIDDYRRGPALSIAYTDFLASWFDHDVAALRDLYGRLPNPPAWVRAAP